MLVWSVRILLRFKAVSFQVVTSVNKLLAAVVVAVAIVLLIFAFVFITNTFSLYPGNIEFLRLMLEVSGLHQPVFDIEYITISIHYNYI